MPYPKKGECRNTGKTRFKKGRKAKLSEEHKRKIGEANKLSVKRFYENGGVSPRKGKKFPKQSGKNHPNWKGGRYYHTSGYIYVLQPSHPFSNNQGYIFEHTIVMEKKIGRLLDPREEVHHINGKRDDNHPDNLHLFKNKSEHIKFHSSVKTPSVVINNA